MTGKTAYKETGLRLLMVSELKEFPSITTSGIHPNQG